MRRVDGVTPRFVVDTMLGRLARGLRAMGYDTLYPGQAEDRHLLQQGRADGPQHRRGRARAHGSAALAACPLPGDTIPQYWDVHHGNGTQKAFYRDPGVLTISIHQDRWYPPESGAMEECGEGLGLGYNINIPLPPGSGHGAYLAAVERVVVPALRAFRPELIIVPSGFDGSMYDPLGRMMAYSETYRAMTRMLMAAADELCGGRLVLSHEGGYSPLYVPLCGLAVMEELTGVKTAVIDPMAARVAIAGGQELEAHQEAVIRRAEAFTSLRP